MQSSQSTRMSFGRTSRTKVDSFTNKTYDVVLKDNYQYNTLPMYIFIL